MSFISWPLLSDFEAVLNDKSSIDINAFGSSGRSDSFVNGLEIFPYVATSTFTNISQVSSARPKSFIEFSFILKESYTCNIDKLTYNVKKNITNHTCGYSIKTVNGTTETTVFQEFVSSTSLTAKTVILNYTNLTSLKFRIYFATDSTSNPIFFNSFEISGQAFDGEYLLNLIPPTISSLAFANRSLTINLNNTNQTVSGYTYSLDNGDNWTTVSSVSLTELVISKIVISKLVSTTFNVIIKAKNNNEISIPSDMVEYIFKTVEELQTENYTVKQILDYGYVITDVSIDETVLKTLISSETSLSILIDYEISPAKIRRYGNFVLQDFKNLSISPSVLSPGKPTITGIEFPTSTTRKITCSLEDSETPGPTSFQIFENNVLIKTILSTDVNAITNQDGTISLVF